MQQGSVVTGSDGTLSASALVAGKSKPWSGVCYENGLIGLWAIQGSIEDRLKWQFSISNLLVLMFYQKKIQVVHEKNNNPVP